MTPHIMVSENYFNWMCDKIDADSFCTGKSYRKLLRYLYDRDFIFENHMDENRAIDGINLRYQYDESVSNELLNKPCSMLEMMVALSIRCENDIMSNLAYGDRTSKWFWGMIGNLMLYNMSDDQFNVRMAKHRIDVLLNREYGADGRGGLFSIKNCPYDLRNVDIWYQMNWYLNTIAY